LWINLTYYGSDLFDYSYDDYRRFVVSHFRLLFYFCTLADDTLNDALSIFRSNTLISKRAQSRQVVVAEMEASVNQFRSSIPQAFMRKLDFIRQMAQGNGLVSSIGSNWYPISLEGKEFMAMKPRSYGDNNCSCGTNPMCASSAAIDGEIVHGLLVGCYPLESLLQSTLECLYNMTCINKLKKTNQFSDMSIRPLNSTLSPPNVTVQSLLDAFMVDRWESSITYEHYYAACAPLSCTYVIREQANLIYMITTIIGFFGGLTVALKIIVPVLMKIARYLIMCRQRRVEPNVTVIA
jgi:hypothetical protein